MNSSNAFNDLLRNVLSEARELRSNNAPLTPELRQIVQQLLARESKTLWRPFPGTPQEQAYNSTAHEILYGGAAGGGKTALGIGLALTKHRRSLILRRSAVNVVDIVEQIKRFATAKHWRGSGWGGILSLPGPPTRVVEVGGCDHEDDKEKYQGRPHDLIVFDEATHFTRSQVLFVGAWNRHEDPAQACRIVYATNPPTTPEGRWIVEEFAPWIDADYKDEPAGPGELRWFTRHKDQTHWLDGPEEVVLDGERVKPRSRTFIPAVLKDNPLLSATDYGARLQALPEPLRSQLLYGDMSAGLEDDPWQVIPTTWVRAAMKRWTPTPPCEQTTLGVDPARGGKDKFVIASRHGPWFGKLKKRNGADVPDGPTGAHLVVRERQGDALLVVDVIGIGSSVYDSLKTKGDWVKVSAFNGAESRSIAGLRDKSGRLKFANLRAASHWCLREALDPDNGEEIALPPDNELLADLCAPRYKVQGNGILVEKKEDIVGRIGRSPDCGDAVVMANWGGRGPVTRGMQVFSLGSGTKTKGLRVVVGSRAQLAGLQTEHRALLVFFADPDPEVKQDGRDPGDAAQGVRLRAGGPLRLPNGLVELNSTNGGHIDGQGDSLDGVDPANGRGDTPSAQGEVLGAGDRCGLLQRGGGVRGNVVPGDAEREVGHALARLTDQPLVFTSFADVTPHEHQATWGEPIPPWGLPAERLLMAKDDGKRLWSYLRKKREYAHDIVVFADEGDRRALSAAYAFLDVLCLPRAIITVLGGDETNKHAGPAPNPHVYQTVKASRGSVV
jgi:hypothetical protein